MGLFEDFILREANQTSQPPLPKMPNKPQERPDKQDLPPDATAYDAAGNPKGQGAGAKEVAPSSPNDSQPPPDGGGPPQADGGDPGGGNAPPDGEGEPPADGGDPGSGDAPPDGEEGDPSGDGTDDGGEGDPNAAGEEPPPQAPGFEEDEKKLFADLKPEQMDIKIKELKSQYKNLHIAIEHTVDKINKVSPTTYDAEVLDVIIRKLISLRKLVRDSVSDTFQTRTYIENKQELQRFKNIFNNIAYLLDEVYKSRMKRKENAEIFAKKQKSKFERDVDFPLMFSRGYDLQ